VFQSAVCFAVVLFVRFFGVAEVAHVFLQISLSEEDAVAVWAFVVLVAVGFRHS
jgi:hypothetical protein